MVLPWEAAVAQPSMVTKPLKGLLLFEALSSS